MKKKAKKGPTRKKVCRNLYWDFKRNDYFHERTWNGKRQPRRYFHTTDLKLAREMRDALEAAQGIPSTRTRGTAAGKGPDPTLRDFAARYLREATGGLGQGTRADRHSLFREGGPIMEGLGDLRVKAIDVDALREWYLSAPVQKLAHGTQQNYINALSKLFGYAVVVKLLRVGTNPVDGLREFQRFERGGTKKSRHARRSRANPIESLAKVERVLEEARAFGARYRTPAERLRPYVAVLLGVDAGLRKGEIRALRYDDVNMGESAKDPARHLRVHASINKYGHLGETKSGEERKVALSRRLRQAISELRMAQGNPEGDALILDGMDLNHFALTGFKEISKRTGVGKLGWHRLRDTYASQLLTAGVSLGYISEQLGHANVAITARHYARWCGGSEYREPEKVDRAGGELPCDLLARMCRSALAEERNRGQVGR